MADERDRSAMYRTRAGGEFPESIDLIGRAYAKVEDLRYGPNPHQPAALYRPVHVGGVVAGAHDVLRTGKGGLSLSNVEDMHRALGILKYRVNDHDAVLACNQAGAAMVFAPERCFSHH